MPELLAGAAGIIISLAMSYIPGVAEWFRALEGVQKRGVLGLALLLAAAIVTALSCAGYVGEVACTEAGLVEVGRALVTALVTSQAAYVMTPGAAKRRDITPDVE